MERLLERLRRGSGAPLRQHELASIIGYSVPTVRKLIEAKVIRSVGLTEERRIPVQEAARIARDLEILKE